MQDSATTFSKFPPAEQENVERCSICKRTFSSETAKNWSPGFCGGVSCRCERDKRNRSLKAEKTTARRFREDYGEIPGFGRLWQRHQLLARDTFIAIDAAELATLRSLLGAWEVLRDDFSGGGEAGRRFFAGRAKERGRDFKDHAAAVQDEPVRLALAGFIDEFYRLTSD